NQNVSLGGLTTTGDVSITATNGSIIDNGDIYTDITAGSLRLFAGTGIGIAGGFGALETMIDILSARSGNQGLQIIEGNGLTVDDVAVTVQKTGLDGSTSAVTDVLQSDIQTESLVDISTLA